MNKALKTIIGIVVIIIIISLIFVFSGEKKIERETIKIGAILSMTGDLAKYGEGVKNGINMAIEDFNTERGTDLIIELIIEDDLSCKVKEAVTATKKLITVDKVDFIVGPMCSAAAVAAAPIAEENITIMISPSASTPDLSGSGRFIFRTYPSDKLKSIETVEFVATTLGFKKIALLTDIANDSFVQQREERH